MAVEDRRAVLQSVPGGTPSRVAICQLAKAQSAQSFCKEEGMLEYRNSVGAYSHRGLLKAPRFYFGKSREREQCCLFVCLLLQVGSMSPVLLLLQSVYVTLAVSCS